MEEKATWVHVEILFPVGDIPLVTGSDLPMSNYCDLVADSCSGCICTITLDNFHAHPLQISQEHIRQKNQVLANSDFMYVCIYIYIQTPSQGPMWWIAQPTSVVSSCYPLVPKMLWWQPSLCYLDTLDLLLPMGLFNAYCLSDCNSLSSCSFLLYIL